MLFFFPEMHSSGSLSTTDLSIWLDSYPVLNYCSPYLVLKLLPALSICFWKTSVSKKLLHPFFPYVFLHYGLKIAAWHVYSLKCNSLFMFIVVIITDHLFLTKAPETNGENHIDTSLHLAHVFFLLWVTHLWNREALGL